jgi:hypothetical protein
MLSGTVAPQFAFYDATQPQLQSSPSRFFPTNNVNSRPGTVNSGPFHRPLSTNGVMPVLGSPSYPGQGYMNLPLPPSPGEPPFTNSPSAGNQGNMQNSDAISGRYMNRFGESSVASNSVTLRPSAVANQSHL